MKFAVLILSLLLGLVHGRIAPQSVSSFISKGWVTTGDAFASSQLVRLVPDRQSRAGGFWSTEPILFRDWEVTFGLRIHGSSAVGADGLAFWYTRETGGLGSLFGNEELFTGLGVVVDTYDNANTGVHPYLMALHNDGSFHFTYKDHDHTPHPLGEGVDAATVNGELGGCTARLRNTRDPVYVNVRYVDSALTVSYFLDENNPDRSWTECVHIPRISLPTGYYFGFTAATGDLADDHDITNITIKDVRDTIFSQPPQQQQEIKVPVVEPAPSTRGLTSTDKSLIELSAKLDGVVSIVSDTLRTLSAKSSATPSATPGSITAISGEISQVLATTRSVQTQVNSLVTMSSEHSNMLRQLSADIKALQNTKQPNNFQQQQQQQNTNQKSGSGGFWNSLLLLALVIVGALAAWFFVQLSRERSQKKLF